MNEISSFVQRTGKGNDIGPNKALDILEVGSKSPDFREFVKSLMVISQHAHIRVNIGESGLDAEIYALKGQMDALGNTVFPLLNRSDKNSPLEWRKEEGEGFSAKFLKENMPKLIDRYRDFPELVKALKHVEGLIASSKDVKQFFRDNLNPEQVSALRKKYDKTFRTVEPVYVKRSDVATEAEKLELQKVKNSLSITKIPGN